MCGGKRERFDLCGLPAKRCRMKALRNAYKMLINLRESRTNRSTLLIALLAATGGAFCSPGIALASAYVPFDGEQTTWHDGFERYDYLMDDTSFTITPFKRPESEK